MILLLGGTSETAPTATALAEAGYRVLVSTATTVPLAVGTHPAILHRQGRLGPAEMAALVQAQHIRAIVDVTHPYASEVRGTAAQVAAQVAIPYLTYVRPGLTNGSGDVLTVESHEEAARVACRCGKPILLTIGSTHVAPYAAIARRDEIPLVARVLDEAAAVTACRDAGIAPDCIVSGRGPFSTEETRALIRQFGIGVLVTKDSGDAGGVREKLAAANLEGCKVVVVARPEHASDGICSSLEELLRRVQKCLAPEGRGGPWLVALDLESVLVPEVWHTVARVAGVPDLALTTRDTPDYMTLMRRRMALCRQHNLTLARLRDIVGTMEPLPGAVEFLRWAETRALVVILSDTYHELAWPAAVKLGCPLMICNSLTIDSAGYIDVIQLRPGGKADAVRRFQRLGFRVVAVGDSHNDVEMLRAAESGILFQPCAGVSGFPSVSSFPALRRVTAGLFEGRQYGENRDE
ncbi:MAG TPA: bifunctional phosphoserine phosphatase/homoserine phosphotransferase ThrH [Alphaproteobacteria bacterium]|nr:bifunctional phosphoserine phosphatase/homoserine phosphotransferase ThrH [Alphaproteobacteria bacterium]